MDQRVCDDTDHVGRVCDEIASGEMLDGKAARGLPQDSAEEARTKRGENGRYDLKSMTGISMNMTLD